MYLKKTWQTHKTACIKSCRQRLSETPCVYNIIPHKDNLDLQNSSGKCIIEVASYSKAQFSSKLKKELYLHNKFLQ